MTVSQFLANTDSREITLWMALDSIEAEERKTQQLKADLIARAEAARRK